MFKEFYEKMITLHQDKANHYLMGDMKKYLHHAGELKNYRFMLENIHK